MADWINVVEVWKAWEAIQKQPKDTNDPEFLARYELLKEQVDRIQKQADVFLDELANAPDVIAYELATGVIGREEAMERLKMRK